MPKAEKGTPKDLANRMKSRGLQKLAFYCQVCEKQMRDQNGFKQHCASEPHVRMMLLVGQNPSKAIGDYSRQFKHDFLQLLRTAHGEKRIQANHFYQEYIQNKSHIHMNGTHWKTLSEFVKGLGREGICRVDDSDKGLFISWIDNSPEALNRQAAIRKKDRQDKGDEERANQLLAEQISKAKVQAEAKSVSEQTLDHESSLLPKKLPEKKMSIKFGFKLPGKGTVDGLTADQAILPAVSGAKDDPTGPKRPSTPEANKSEGIRQAPEKKKSIFASQKPAEHSSKTNHKQQAKQSTSLTHQGLSNVQQMLLEEEQRQRRKTDQQRSHETSCR